ncbi:CDF family Co(II)/Ni(II) efflux transporter DmeF [Paraferrimonas sedimenticola]|uniref:Cation transporter n=1 Tax=Paraferrimonas sedimenticola TaxID=375674 RepID=A0AA37W0T9_9GAMM|nr:CDF family Co(II)/Ni(II) efflux transporter DmeF [Paraferrimonas sedimenticola]GLP96520.1 cation transporter [Paraferrimonas sedimenticola]
MFLSFCSDTIAKTLITLIINPMQERSLENWQHSHQFGLAQKKNERRTLYAVIITAAMMFVEIVAGYVTGSMALLADGWHMATHVAAFGLTLFAYRYARRAAKNPLYSFGSGKVNILAGFTSAVALILVALMMAIESVWRLIEPVAIDYQNALFVAVIGLIVNLVCAYLLHQDDDHHHGHHHHGHSSDEHHHDHNLYAAYLHVIADALTSLTAILALLAARYFDMPGLDPIMGVVGAIIITRWGWGLIKDTYPTLLDRCPSSELSSEVKSLIEQDSDNQVVDLHIWKLSGHHSAAIISVVTQQPKQPEYYKALLNDVCQLAHITVEVHQV